jgi:hypothetical protein
MFWIFILGSIVTSIAYGFSVASIPDAFVMFGIIVMSLAAVTEFFRWVSRN